MSKVFTNKSDKKGYNEFYKGAMYYSGSNKLEFENEFKSQIKPYCEGGITKGYVRGLSVQYLIDASHATGKNFNEIIVLDAGCGLGGLSMYLALLGFNVVGVDISKEACNACENLAKSLGVNERTKFYAVSLDEMPISDASVDFIIGHASLHHFIKYEQVPNEFYRVLKHGGEGFFSDSFGENKLYRIFQDKEKMRRLGDVSLNKNMVKNYFKNLNPVIIPTDWFVMLDKLYIKIFPSSAEFYLRKISKLHFWLDRKMSVKSRLALSMSGAILTKIKK